VALSPGKYNLRMSLRELPSGSPVQVQKAFSVYQHPTVVAEPATAATRLAVGIEVLTEKDVEDEFQRAKYLADKTEIYFFEQLKTAQAKKDFLKDFWSRRESDATGETPLRRVDYLRRVEVATERYTSYTKKGWRTDRGRVFIVYGKADEIERHPSEGIMKPYEIWYYYQIENGVQFVFVDKSGFGDYELVHSTKRGEFSDEGWDRFLQ
jgi:GWxTD domain-containing protein